MKSMEININCELEVLKILFNKEVDICQFLEAKTLGDFNDNLNDKFCLTQIEWKILQEVKRKVFDL